MPRDMPPCHDCGRKAEWKSFYLSYCSELATLENALLAFEPTSRIVPTTSTRMTANITAYSAMSWPSSSIQILRNTFIKHTPYIFLRILD